jgi:transposase
MEPLYTCCAGVDIHKQTVVACLLGADGRAENKEIRTCGTTTAALSTLRDWLLAAGCTHVAMEATGSFWKPVYNILDGYCTLLVVNAAHITQVPGRKTDVADAEWIATLLKHGLVRPSFIPSREQRELRDLTLTRTRTSLTDERSAAVNRIQQVLEDANIKLAGVATDRPTSWGFLVETSWRLCSAGRWRQAPWPSWPAASCAASARPWSRHCRVGWAPIIAC